MTIWKFPLTIGVTTITVPENPAWTAAKESFVPLSVAMQHGELQMWAMVDPSASAKRVIVVTVYGTGHPMPDKPGIFVGSVQDGPYVWHVFAQPGGFVKESE